MANSRDTRKHTRWQRGAKRYDDVGGHSPVGDELENTRDHERIWFELRRHKNCCCDPDDPGFRYCVGEKADYPTLICDGYLLPAGALIDYFGGGGNNDGVASSWYLQAGCGSNAKAYSEPFGTATFFEDGSWRNGPFVTGMGKPGLFQSTAEGWFGAFFNEEFSFEYWIKPSPTDIATGAFLTYSGPFKFVEDGGLFTGFTAGGGISFTQQSIGTVLSADGVFTADQWNHVVYVRKTTNGGSFSIYVNGVRVLYTPLATDLVADGDNTFGYGGASGSQWSDIARYRNAISASAIFRHYRALADDYGLTPPVGDEPQDDPAGGGGGVQDPGDYVFDLPLDRIDGEGKEGYIAVSDGDTAAWMSPEDSPFELEERKGQADGYAALDGDVLVPSEQLGDASAAGDPVPTSVLTKSDTDVRIWTPGLPVPKPTVLGQMLRADPGPSDDYEALVAANLVLDATPGSLRHWPLTDASAPFAPSVGSGDLSASGVAPTSFADPDVAFADESVVLFDDTDGLGFDPSPGNLWDAGRWLFAFWIKLTELPASTVRIAGTGAITGAVLQADGQVSLVVHNTILCESTTLLVPGEWYHVVVANDGGDPGGRQSAVWVNGVKEGTFDGSFATPWSFGGFVVGGDGLHAELAHFTYSYGEFNGVLTDAEVLAVYQARRPTWTLIDEVGGVSGIDASEDDTPVTIAPRSRFNFKAGANVSLGVVDDEAGDEVEVTIAATSPAGSGIEASEGGVDVTAAPRGRLDFVASGDATVDVTDDGANDKAVVTIGVALPPDELPDTTGASEGDVLTLDASLDKIWAPPPAGGGGGGDYPVGTEVTVIPAFVQASVAGAFGWSGDGNQYGGGYVQNTSTHALNDEVSLGSVALGAGDWVVDCYGISGPDRAIWSIKLDGTVEATADFYTAGLAFNKKVISTLFTVASAGDKALAVKAASKNAAGSNYYLTLSRLVFRRVA